ncbi:MAG: cation transporter dimerization domain-containing protein [Candidatus Hodarchaeales archaeon]|jgi:divalent metal cation (Fe/Co/Zn/Cd) transporter
MGIIVERLIGASVQIFLGLKVLLFSDLLQVNSLNVQHWVLVLFVAFIMIIIVELVKFTDRWRHKTSPYQLIFAKIQQIQHKLPKIRNLHNLSVDIMENKILIQFHFNIPAETTLELAHEIARSLED